jgi:uncharacterized protein YbjQ (UPF0145 family)
MLLIQALLGDGPYAVKIAALPGGVAGAHDQAAPEAAGEFEPQPPAERNMQDAMVTTALTLPGFRVVRNVGVVRGITVRSRSIVGNFFGGLQSLFGGNITIYTNLCERARSDTYRLMCEHAEQRGANAIISMHYDATELMTGLTEVLCYGTAVIVERERPGASP